MQLTPGKFGNSSRLLRGRVQIFKCRAFANLGCHLTTSRAERLDLVLQSPALNALRTLDDPVSLGTVLPRSAGS